ncbi:MAG: prophage regulatory protein [Sphingomonadales bacterium]|jgi:prophage regulatory protein|nr:prophage regulatory protein [Sphingomonadales bacterium]
MIAQTAMSPETRRRRELQAVAEDPLLTRRQVEAECGLSRSTIYRRIAGGTFPRPKQVGPQAVRWPRSEIVGWKARQPVSEPRI